MDGVDVKEWAWAGAVGAIVVLAVGLLWRRAVRRRFSDTVAPDSAMSSILFAPEVHLEDAPGAASPGEASKSGAWPSASQTVR